MARHQDRTWYVLPTPRRMTWRCNGESITVTVMAFSFQDDVAYWLTFNSTVISGHELTDAGEKRDA